MLTRRHMLKTAVLGLGGGGEDGGGGGISSHNCPVLQPGVYASTGRGGSGSKIPRIRSRFIFSLVAAVETSQSQSVVFFMWCL